MKKELTKKMCAGEGITWQIRKVTFFSINTIEKYIYILIENIIRNIKSIIFIL